MGSSIAPKNFAPSTPFGQTPPTPVTTETQPLAQNTGTQTPAMSGYQMNMQTPITSPMTQPTDGAAGSPQDLLKQFKQNRQINSGGGRLPFYG
jgi:hypothetical protein